MFRTANASPLRRLADGVALVLIVAHLAAFARAVVDPTRAGPRASTAARRLQDSSCLESCAYTGDGECDDGGPGAEFTDCSLGSDCTDCGARGANAAPSAGSMCTDVCQYPGDGICDDGGAGSLYNACTLGSDCSDCGPRASASPPQPPASPAHSALAVSGLCPNYAAAVGTYTLQGLTSNGAPYYTFA
eukprot:1534720-Prymnesium_polylepis.1